MIRRIALVSVLLFVGADVLADTIVDTTNRAGLYVAGNIGYEAFAGESVIVPRDNILKSVSFYVEQYDPAQLSDLFVSVFTYDGTNAGYSPIFTSNQVPIPSTANVLQEFTFDMENLVLTPGQQYAILLSGGTGLGLYLSCTNCGADDAGGHFVWKYLPTDAAGDGGFTENYYQGEVAMVADFGPSSTAVPEPSCVLLLGVGIISLPLFTRCLKLQKGKINGKGFEMAQAR